MQQLKAILSTAVVCLGLLDWPEVWKDALAVGGVLLVYAGVREIYPPAGLILLGVAAILVAFRS